MKHAHHKPAARQRGVTLIELLVGITIGLLTIAVALGALMVSRGISGTVSDASEIQQQAAYAFRVMGQQLRQAGSLRLSLAAQKPANAIDIDMADPVAFETDYVDPDGGSTFTLSTDTLNGIDSPSAGEYKLTVGYRNYKERLYTSTDPEGESLMRNCLGEGGTKALVQSRFVLNTATNELRCVGTNPLQPQPIVRNVANFQVRYLLQTAAGTGSPQIQYVNATSVGGATDPRWSQVFGVEVCLVLYGNEAIDMPAPANAADTQGTYMDCDAATRIDMTALPAPRTRRMHMVFRNIYQLRSQGQTG